MEDDDVEENIEEQNEELNEEKKEDIAASLCNVCKTTFTFCCLSARVPLPTYSALKRAIMLSTTISFILGSAFTSSGTLLTNNTW